MDAATYLRGIIVSLALCPAAAIAQTSPPAPAPPPPVGPDPAATTATYGDWVLRCQSANVASSPKRVCEVIQTMQLQGQREPVAQVAFGKTPTGGSLHIVVALPVNISFPSRVSVAMGESDRRPLDLDWRRCIPGACFADGIASLERITAWRTMTTPGSVAFKDASGRPISLPLSFRGLAPALDALDATP